MTLLLPVPKELDAMQDLIDRKREIDTYEYTPDQKELAEREEAATRYSMESEQHFVDYCIDCLKQSIDAHKEIRRVQGLCWSVYEENEPPSYAEKEEWQAKTVIPKPFETVQYGAAAIRKAFSPDFLSIRNARNKQNGEFWRRVMEYHLNEQHGNFVVKFADAVTMALAIGTSMEMVPRFVSGSGLEFVNVETWKIHRDADALPREPHSGMYWIHQEWLDYWVLKEGEKKNRYHDVSRVKDVENIVADNPMMTKEAVAARKKMLYERSRFRTSVLTSEFHGTILAPNGELLLENGTYTLGANRVIKAPRATRTPYRWPGVSFSPLPHLLRFDGRGLLEGVLTVWEAMCNILCLHQDYLQWVVNPPREINVDGLNNPKDAALHPGKDVLTRNTSNGQQVIRIEQRRSRTSDVLANQQYYDQIYQRGTFVSDQIMGLPGWRKDEPYRLAAMNLDQALMVFGLMGNNVEEGAIQAITMAAQVVRHFAGYRDYLEIFSEEELKRIGIEPDPNSPNGVSGVPEFDGQFHVSGIQALMRDNECLRNLKEIFVPLSERPGYAPYLKPYRILQAIEIRTNMTDEKVVADEEEAKVIDLVQQLATAKQQEAMQRMQELQEALGITELVKQIQEIQSMSKNIKEIASGIMQIPMGMGENRNA